MPDEVYQPLSENDEETPSPQTELPIESWSEFKSKLGEGTDRSDLTVEEATQRRRPPDPHSAESAWERPITVHKVKGDGPLGLNEAVDDLRFSRAQKLGADLRASGLSEHQVGEMADDAIRRGEGIEPLAPPPPEVKGLDKWGHEDDGPINVEEAAKQLTDWRERHAAEQQEALQELAGEAVQHAQADLQAQQPTEQQQPQPQAQPTPEQTERQQLAQERQRLASLKRSEGAEVVARLEYDQLVAAVVQEFPSLRTALPTPEQLQDLRVREPERFQRLANYDQALRERQARIASLTQQRSAREQQQLQAAAQERATARARQDAAFEKLASQHIPNWETAHSEIRAQARRTLENAGLLAEELHHLWNGDHDGIDVHSSVLQLVLAKAAQWDLAQQRAHQIRQTPVPPVMRPGTYRTPSDGAESVRELSNRLSRASGREALRIATQLQRAKRASGD